MGYCYKPPHKIRELCEVTRYIGGSRLWDSRFGFGLHPLAVSYHAAERRTCTLNVYNLVSHNVSGSTQSQDVEGIPLEFRLTYRGSLPASTASNSRMKPKHLIRREFNKQLRNYWNIHPELQEHHESELAGNNEGGFISHEVPHYQIGDKSFLPLLTERRGLACALDILFLRRDAPGKVVTNGGDIDNRLKTLFDALRVPQNSAEIPSDWEQDIDEFPLYCLLDDDGIITTVSVTTDRLLTPLENEESVNDVLLVIKVEAIITNFTTAPWGFIARERYNCRL